MTTKAEKIIQALRTCQQFLPARTAGATAINLLSGERVEPIPVEAGAMEDDGFLLVTFPGGLPVEVIGDMYLELQVHQSIRIEVDRGMHDRFPGIDKLARVYADRIEHLRGKHGL